MATEPPPPNLDELERRLKQARPEPVETGVGAADRPRAMGMAFRVSVELVSALAVGVGLGWLLDYWLGTGPWMMVVMFFLGAAAGMLNVYRAVEGLGFGRWSKGSAATKEEDRGERG
ncbi:MAG: AtpZ/AtpI family protein [Alphaproteobacteria bacterium]|nr:AtpZ/AtpI family protein [Alphaproteobacteria bacterium]